MKHLVLNVDLLKNPSMTEIYRFSAHTLGGTLKPLSEFEGQVLLIVNSASQCGFTPQLSGLQHLYDRYKERGFSVLAFPCNQFRQQEPGTNEEIGSFCERNYGVTFPVFAKVDVNGSHAHPLFRHLKHQAPGVLGTGFIKWNFTKFLVSRDGRTIRRFGPNTPPEAIAPAIEELLDR